MDKINLTLPSIVTGGFQEVHYPTSEFDLRTEISNLLVKKGFVESAVPLEDLHLHVTPEDMSVDHIELNNVTKGFYETSSVFHDTYFRMIKWISQNFFDFDFLFQEIPTIRFHFPVRYSDMFRQRMGWRCFNMWTVFWVTLLKRSIAGSR